MVKPRDKSVADVLMDFANDSLKGESDDGRAKIDNRALIVDGEILAMRSRAVNTYVNDDHPNTVARGRLLCFLPASEVIHLTKNLTEEVAICLKVVDKKGESEV